MVDSRKCKNVILVYKVLPTKKKLRIYIEKSLNKKRNSQAYTDKNLYNYKWNKYINRYKRPFKHTHTHTNR